MGHLLWGTASRIDVYTAICQDADRLESVRSAESHPRQRLGPLMRKMPGGERVWEETSKPRAAQRAARQAWGTCAHSNSPLRRAVCTRALANRTSRSPKRSRSRLQIDRWARAPAAEALVPLRVSASRS